MWRINSPEELRNDPRVSENEDGRRGKEIGRWERRKKVEVGEGGTALGASGTDSDIGEFRRIGSDGPVKHRRAVCSEHSIESLLSENHYAHSYACICSEKLS